LVNQIPEADEKNNLNWAVLQQIVIQLMKLQVTEERMVRNGQFNKECTEATKNKNKAYSKMIKCHKTRGA
jgi:hypothetical protein